MAQKAHITNYSISTKKQQQMGGNFLQYIEKSQQSMSSYILRNRHSFCLFVWFFLFVCLYLLRFGFYLFIYLFPFFQVLVKAQTTGFHSLFHFWVTCIGILCLLIFIYFSLKPIMFSCILLQGKANKRLPLSKGVFLAKTHHWRSHLILLFKSIAVRGLH